MEEKPAQAESSVKTPGPAPYKPNWKLILIIIIVLSLLAAALVGAFYYIYPQDKSDYSLPTKQATSSAKKATDSAGVQTQNWKTFMNEKAGYSIKYPEDWLLDSYKDGPSCNQVSADGLATFFAPMKDLLGICNSEFGGLVSVVKTESGTSLAEQVQQQKDSFKLKDVGQRETTIAGKKAVKLSGTSQLNEELANFLDYKIIKYFVEVGDYLLIVGYTQSPQWQDYSKEFELMVSTLEIL
jgi:hypothetical protein